MSSLFVFADHVALFSYFLDRRREIVDAIEAQLLNVRGKELAASRDRRQFERLLHACFFERSVTPAPLAALKGQLQARHVADGFEPTRLDQFTNELDPLELVVRGYEHWNLTRWPGASGRMSYAQCLYAVFMLRQFERLSLRVWDDGRELAGARLAEVQSLLDRLNEPGKSTVFVRDARWLVQTAQGPLTPHLEPYLRISNHISGSFDAGDRIALHKAGAKLTAGHLRSQLRYGVWRTGKTIDDPDILAFTRNSNSMDNAVLLRDLLPLLEAYKAACGGGNAAERLDLADAILQGISADAELFLTRLDLLAPYTSIETLFIEQGDDGRPRYSDDGSANLRVLERYASVIGEVAPALREDAASFTPAGRAYSPFGIVYGFCADVLANIAMDVLVGQPSFGLSLEDMFVSRTSLDDKLTRATGWRTLPRREGENEHFEHTTEFGSQVYARLMSALDDRAGRDRRPNASPYRDGHLFVVPEGESAPADFAPADAVPAQEYCFTTDIKRAAATGAMVQPVKRILSERREGSFAASAETGGVWFGVSKFVLTFVTSQGKDALLTDVPAGVIDVMRLTCGALVKRPGDEPGHASSRASADTARAPLPARSGNGS